MMRFWKTSTRAGKGTFLVLTLLCLLMATAFRPTHPVSPGARPFSGSYEGSIEVPVGIPEQPITFTVTGHASQLGRFEMTAEGDLNLETLELTNASATFTAANGDELYTTYRSSGVSNGDGSYTVNAEHTITGGTGRFEDAEGSFLTTSQARIMTTLETVTIVGTVYMKGTIRY